MSDPIELTPSLYGELEERARAILGLRRLCNQPETLSLVHQACLKIMKGEPQPKFETRAEFLAFSAKTMRHVLIDLARSRNALMRGGGKPDLPLEAAGDPADRQAGPEAEILDVHEKLKRLAANDPKLAQLVELKFFGGCTFQEIADVIGGTRQGAEAEWQFAKVWLRGALSED